VCPYFMCALTMLKMSQVRGTFTEEIDNLIRTILPY
jgi:hypothetical protein